jgi:predicted RNA binding protein YcfA (HicA-like mRNA interferase family)
LQLALALFRHNEAKKGKFLKPKEAASILKKHGFIEKPQSSGTSHRKYFNPSSNKTATVPIHNKDLKLDTLASIIRQSGIPKEDFK